MKKIAGIAFIVLAFIQWAIPVHMIWKKELVLKRGSSFKFQTEPVDPTNPFKGKYILLRFKADRFSATGIHKFSPGQQLYVLLANDDSGFARIRELSQNKPSQTADYVIAKINYFSNDDSETVYLEYPFEEFYLEEFKAPRAETAYRKSNTDESKRTFALVKVWRGDAVIQDVLINDTSIRYLIK